jgi:hypothetical protein
MSKFIVRFILVSTIAGGLNWGIGHNLPPIHGPRYYLFASQFSLGIGLVISEGIITICSSILSIKKSSNKPRLQTKLDDLLRELPPGHPDTMKVIELLASLEEKENI